MFKKASQILIVTALFVLLVGSSIAQTTAFSYSGRLADLGMPANGNYDLEFKIYDAAAGGTLLATLDRLNTSVANGDYSTSLDFGSGVFTGSARYMEISYRMTGTGNPYTPIASRDNLTIPYAINAANATNANNSTQLGGTPAAQFTQTNDSRLTDARNPLPGSPNYIQNTTAQQLGSNFNVGGTGTASILNAGTQFNFGGNRILASPGTNTYIGLSTGAFNTTGVQNTYAGLAAGMKNTAGSNNSFFGFNAGWQSNAFDADSFFGSFAGSQNTSGSYNSFFGEQAGVVNTTGQFNTFFGFAAGFLNTTGSSNTIVGSQANVGANNLTNASAIGANALVAQSNSLVLGSIAGTQSGATDTSVGIGTTAPAGRLQVVTSNDTSPTTITAWDPRHFIVGGTANTGAIGMSYDRTNNVGYLAALTPNVAWRNLVIQSGGGNVGIGTGTSAVSSKLQIIDASNTGLRVQTNTAGGTVASFGGAGAFQIDANGIVGGRLTVTEAGNVGINVTNPRDRLDVAGAIGVTALGTGGSTALCRNSFNQISTCSSSLRYKTNVASFSPGLSLVRKLHPISFDWKADGMRDLGFGAEDIAKIEPRFVTYNEKGEVEGVKYDRISVVLVNAVKEQQTEIEALKTEVDALKALLCAKNAKAKVCKK